MSNTPYSPPAIQVDNVYFATEPCRASFSEILRITKPNPINMTIGMILRLFRISIRPVHGIAFNAIQSVNNEQMPPVVHETLREYEEALRQLGFHYQFSATTPVLGDGYCFSKAYSSPDQVSSASLFYSVLRFSGREKRQFGLTFYSEAQEIGIGTTDIKHQLDASDFLDFVHRPGLRTDELYKLHQQRLQTKRSLTFNVINEASAWECYLRTEKRLVEYNQQRGVFRSMTTAEIDQILKQQHRQP